MICVTGAGGTVGSELIKQLESVHAQFRAAYFSPEKVEAVRARGRPPEEDVSHIASEAVPHNSGLLQPARRSGPLNGLTPRSVLL